MESNFQASDLLLSATLDFPSLPWCPQLSQEKFDELERLRTNDGEQQQCSEQQPSAFTTPKGAEDVAFRQGYDLIAEAASLLELLHEVDAAKELALYSPAGMRVAMYRYEVLWLPLLVRTRRTDIAPPLDVAWAWLMHALAPSKYAADVERVLAVPAVSLTVVGALQRSRAALANGKLVWEDAYGQGMFQPPGHEQGAARAARFDWPAFAAFTSSGSSKISYDLVCAAGRQQVFLYQVSLPHWRCGWFLERCLGRYKGFLVLHREHPQAFLVPTFDIDLFWHAHMASHAVYVEDVQRVTGNFFDHDDSINDRTQGSQLNHGFQATCDLWRQNFGTEYIFEGGMFRGRPPSDFLKAFCRKKGLLEDYLLASSTHKAVQKGLRPQLRQLALLSAAEFRDGGKGGRDSFVKEYSLRECRKQGEELGRVFARRPSGSLNPNSPPALVVAFDAQGKAAAVSRIIDRAQLPLDLAKKGSEPCQIPTYRHRLEGGPSFLIQECCGQGGDADWAVLQCACDSRGRLQPCLYRLGVEFYGSRSTTGRECVTYNGRMDVNTSFSGISGEQSIQISYSRAHTEELRLRKSNRVSESHQRLTCGTASLLPKCGRQNADQSLAQLVIRRGEEVVMALKDTKQEACIAVFAVTLLLLLEPL